jgi:hypothetical protein
MSDAPQLPPVVAYKPSAYYYRTALRNADTKADAQDVGYAAVSELEHLKEWVREQGMIPPKWNVLAEEARDKGWDRAG